MLLVEFDEFTPDIQPTLLRLFLERLQIASGEVTVRMLSIGQRFVQLHQTPQVTLKVFLVFRVHCP